MEREFTMEEIQRFYPEHAVFDTEHHYLVKDFFVFGDFKLSAKIRKTLPLFKNGNPLLPTRPFCISETDFSVAIGTNADCLHVQGWFGNLYDTKKNDIEPYISFGNIAKANVLLAVAMYDQTQNWFRTGVDSDISSAQRAIKFIKYDDSATDTGADIWLLDTSNATIRSLQRRYVHQRQIAIKKSEDFIRNNTVPFPTLQPAKNALNVPS